MNKVNVLILSAGRRVELIKCFKNGRDELGIEGKVVAVDISDTAPALYHADCFYLVPRVSDDLYIQSIIEVCQKENIDLIIPTIDTELKKLSENKDLIERQTNAKVHVSSEQVINICRDKYNTQDFFEQHGFGVPRLITHDDIINKNYNFPLFIKPLNGSSSINTFKVNNEKELEFFIEYVPSPLVQEFIEGEEFTVDVFTDFEGRPITIVPRIRLATRGGEVAKGLIKKDLAVIEAVKEVVKALKPSGHITIQCMKTKDGIKFIEINPRFGGGAPISIKAGAHSPKYLYQLLMGDSLVYHEEFEEGILGLRYDEAVFLNKEGKVI